MFIVAINIHVHHANLNAVLGYSFKLGRRFYVSPWSALHFKDSGDKHVSVDGKIFKPPFVNPEASIKLGAYF